MLALVWIQFCFSAFQRHFDHRFYLFIQNLVEVNFKALLVLDYGRSLAEAHLVALLQLAIVLVKLLNSIISEVDHRLINGIKSELVGRCSNVAFLEQVASIINRYQYP